MKPPKKIAPGDICWLPKREEIDSNQLKELEGIDGGCFDHPVVLLTIDGLGETATICVLSSLGGKSFEEYCHGRHGSHIKVAQLTLYPIHPAPPHPHTQALLHVQDGLRLGKTSYVRTERSYTVSRKAMKPYRKSRVDDSKRPSRYRLTPESHGQLLAFTETLPSLLRKTQEPRQQLPYNPRFLQDSAAERDSTSNRQVAVFSPYQLSRTKEARTQRINRQPNGYGSIRAPSNPASTNPDSGARFALFPRPTMLDPDRRNPEAVRMLDGALAKQHHLPGRTEDPAIRFTPDRGAMSFLPYGQAISNPRMPPKWTSSAYLPTHNPPLTTTQDDLPRRCCQPQVQQRRGNSRRHSCMIQMLVISAIIALIIFAGIYSNHV